MGAVGKDKIRASLQTGENGVLSEGRREIEFRLKPGADQELGTFLKLEQVRVAGDE